jgi:hypothetical protein
MGWQNSYCSLCIGKIGIEQITEFNTKFATASLFMFLGWVFGIIQDGISCEGCGSEESVPPNGS